MSEPLDSPDALVHRSSERGVTTLTLDSPANRNALSTRLVAELSEGLAQAADDKTVRAVVLTHTGSVFCAGADLKETTSGDPASGPRNLVQLMRAIAELNKPVLAKVNGHVRAGGLGLVGACDIAVAGPKATFAFTEVKLGLAPAVISLPLLPRLDPRAASAWYLTGATFDSGEAARIGLITQSAAAEDGVDAACAQYLDGLRSASPQGLAETKRLVTAEVLKSFDEHCDAMVEMSTRLFASAEAQEGMRAFLERRPPSWAQ